ncbi:hypothetical protein I6E68_09435 [Salinibacterium sp. NSLL150]|uniref:Imm26 family immunity protein n=1 Tax=unclassified Salinibacterium TaxID=2632331 RepID=UPI0018CEC273|nr:MULTISPECIES: Imm26 family immunity protein [unclassified Salinibacterium]MBH0099361.1 hypothetical protein [Salinibacterium sp. NSLL35]MBH0102115.1 hypothetical protein [Salinibacterium sp. NSLL150]MBH0104875.1 hypothetical protein [Salinibacterium sp. NSLL16]MBH0107635.1 hypothetical protein [Salinibacterium sp. NSLL17]
MKTKIKVGDVFIVPTGDGRAGVGQVVGMYRKSYYYFAIFDTVVPLEVADERAIEALKSPLLFLGLSLDAKIYLGHWPVVAHAEVDPSILLPAYKISMRTIDNMHVIDYTGTRSRPATEAEVDFLDFRLTVAPVEFEFALRASLGLEPWLELFDKLKPNELTTTAALFD